MSTLEATLAIATTGNRVCPMPPEWQRLYKVLPDTCQVGNCWQPPLPLILAGWDFSSDQDKRVRLREHIQWASDHGALAAVHDFLLALPAKKWHCED
jgi:hypothetical protein